jgi:hypothetical protein
VRTLAVVMRHVLEDPVEMAAAEHEQAIQGLLADGADLALGEGVRSRRTDRGPDDLHARGPEDLVEGTGELRVPVADQEPDASKPVGAENSIRLVHAAASYS